MIFDLGESKMKTEVLSPTLIKIVNHKYLRKLLVKKIDNYVYKSIVNDDSEDLKQVRLKKYQFLSAMLHCVIRNVGKGYISKEVTRKVIDVLVENNLMEGDQSYEQAVEKFTQKYGEPPPSFIVFSPTQKCNLYCVGCYASSAASTTATIPYPYVDRVVSEVHDSWGSRFITISGGEPFMYKSEGKTLLDIFEKYNDMLFLVYTNGTVINEEVTQRLMESANATPAISVEGFEKETDERRGAVLIRKFLKLLNA